MSKVAEYLQDHVRGEVSVAPSIRMHFAADSSILRQLPQIVVSPLDEQDIRKVARFAWQLAEKGKVLPIVPRGAGTDLGGAAVGQTLAIAFQPHMNKTLEFDDRKGSVMVEPGANFGRLQHMLTFSHGRYLPAYPNSLEYTTIGGAIANNSGGERSLQFGPIGNYVDSMRVVLANGEVIETKRITKKEVSKKMGMPTFEGEIYRALDALLNDSAEAIKAYQPESRVSPGYNIEMVRRKDGSVDLTPLFTGSQGTLGIIVNATLGTEAYRPGTKYVIFSLQSRTALALLQHELTKDKPEVLEYIDQSLLKLAKKTRKSLLGDEIGEDLPAGVVVAEFSGVTKRLLDKIVKKMEKKLADADVTILPHSDAIETLAKKLKRLPQTMMAQRFMSAQLVPGIDDAYIPPAGIHEFLNSAEQLFTKSGVTAVVHARAGEGIIHAYPLIDLAQLGDRQRLFRLTDEYYKLVVASKGSVVGEHGDGRIRAGFVKRQMGDVMYDVMRKVKQIFDPYGIMNPGVKIDVDSKAAFPLLRHEYEITQLYHH